MTVSNVASSAEKRSHRFNATTGVSGYMTKDGPTGAHRHPDRCVCQDETTPHKHYPEPPYRCARCMDCHGYVPAVVDETAELWATRDEWLTVVSENAKLRGELEQTRVVLVMAEGLVIALGGKPLADTYQPDWDGQRAIRDAGCWPPTTVGETSDHDK